MAKVFVSDLTDKKPYKVTVTTGTKSKQEDETADLGPSERHASTPASSTQGLAAEHDSEQTGG